jgi:hypothetical protein
VSVSSVPASIARARDQAEANPITPADAWIGFRHKNRARIRAPPVCYAVGRRDGVKHDFRRRFDVPYESKTGHYFLPWASNSLRSA